MYAVSVLDRSEEGQDEGPFWYSQPLKLFSEIPVIFHPSPLQPVQDDGKLTAAISSLERDRQTQR